MLIQMYSLSRSGLINSLKKATVKKEQRYLNQVYPNVPFLYAQRVSENFRQVQKLNTGLEWVMRRKQIYMEKSESDNW